MPQSALNLDAFRRNALPSVPATSALAERILSKASDSTLTRRGFIGVAGAGVAASTAAIALLERARDAFQLVGDRRRLAFVIAGEELWVIEPARFEGKGRLKIDRAAGRVELTLRGAVFPGTALPADFHALIEHAADGWRMRLDTAFGHFQSVSFVRWLLAEVEATCHGRLDLLACRAGTGALHLAGAARTRFLPSWQLHFSGLEIARISTLTTDAAGDDLSVALLPEDAPSALLAPARRRTLVSLTRGRRAWSITPLRTPIQGWKISAKRDAFDQIDLEVQRHRGVVAAALIATRRIGTGGLAMAGAHTMLSGPEGPSSVGLVDQRLGIALGGSREVTTLFASFPEEPQWLYGNGFAIEVGGAGAEPVELVADHTGVEGRLAPVVRRVALPLDGATSSMIELGDSVPLQLSADDDSRNASAGPACLLIMTADGPELRLALAAPAAIHVVREKDLLSLRLSFDGMDLFTTWRGRRFLRPRSRDDSAVRRMFVQLAPQHIAERAYLKGHPGAPGTEAPDPPPVASAIAGPSQLAFRLPNEEIPFRLADLLHWSRFSLELDPRARKIPPAAADMAMVDPRTRQETYIEFPYRLFLSPTEGARYLPTSGLQSAETGYTELWAAKLASAEAQRPGIKIPIRALWSPDIGAANKPYPVVADSFRTSLNGKDRHEIVHLSSNYSLTDTDNRVYVPEPIQVERMHLTALGASVKLRGLWEPPTILGEAPVAQVSFSVEEWRHNAALGRDVAVRVVRKGYAMPFGHRCAIIKVTKRELEDGADGPVAYLRQYFFMSIRRPEKSFPALGQPFGGRCIPYRRVDLLVAITPPIDPAPMDELRNLPAGQAQVFWPQVMGADFLFPFRAEDHAGNAFEGVVPLLFVDNEVARDRPQEAVAYYNTRAAAARKTVHVGGRRVAYAPSSRPDDTAFATRTLFFGADNPDAGTSATDLYVADQVPFYPRMTEAIVDMDAVRQVAGSDAGVPVRYYETYQEKGFAEAGNRGEVFLAFNKEVQLAFGGQGNANGDRAGGVVTPNASLVGVSRRLGPVGGRALSSARAAGPGVAAGQRDALADIGEGKFNPLEFFGGSLKGARILGAVSLWDIVRPFAEAAMDNLGDAPAMLSETRYAIAKGTLAAHDALKAAFDQVPPDLRARFGSNLGKLDAAAATLRGIPEGTVGTTDAQVKAISIYVAEVKQLASEVSMVIRDPSQLLPGALRSLLGFVGDFPTLVTYRLALPLEPLRTGMTAMTTELDNLAADSLAYGKRVRAQLLEQRSAVLAHLDEMRGIVAAGRDVVGSVLREQPRLVEDVASLLADSSRMVEFAGRAFGNTAQLQEALWSLLRLGVNTEQQLAAWRQAIEARRVQFERRFQDAQSAYRSLLVEQRRVQFFTAKQQIDNALRQLADLPRRMAGDAVEDVNGSRVARVLTETADEVLRVQLRLLTDLIELNRLVISLADEAGALNPPLPRSTADALRGELIGMAIAFTAVAQKNAIGPALAPFRAALTTELQTQVDALTQQIQSAQIPAEATSGLAAAKELVERWDRLREPFQLAVWVLTLDPAHAQALQRAKTAYDTLRGPVNDLRQGFVLVRDTIAANRGKLPAALQQVFLADATPLMTALSQLAQLGRDAEKATLIQVRIALKELSTLWHDVAALIGGQDLAAVVAVLDGLRRQMEQMFLSLLIPDRTTVRYDWNPKVQSFPASNPIFEVKSDDALSVRVRLEVALRNSAEMQAGQTRYELKGSLKNFTINLIPPTRFISLTFSELTFDAETGRKPHIKAHLSAVDLDSSLGYVKQLQRILAPNTGPFIELTTNGIRAGYNFGVDQIWVGSFLVSDLRLFIAADLPFDGSPMRSRFGVSSWDAPFLLTSGIYGGGGFLSIAIGLDGVEEITGALEFGVQARISIGIAKGAGFIRAGMYFSFTRDDTQLIGYVHAGGHLDIIGLISMSLYVAVRISYRTNGNVEGTATVKVKFRIAFVKKTITLNAAYTFAGKRSAALAATALDDRALALMTETQRAVYVMEQEESLLQRAEHHALTPEEFAEYRHAFAW